MRKILILLCAVAVFGLALSAPDAEAQGYNVQRSTAVKKVAQYANNAAVNSLEFVYTSSTTDEVHIKSGASLTMSISYDLLITNDDTAREKTSSAFSLMCDNDGNAATGYEADCQVNADTTKPSATLSNENGKGVIEILPGTSPESFEVVGVRVDASALAEKEKITATVTSNTKPGTQPLDGGTTSGSVSGVVGEVAAGLKVTATQSQSLACSKATQPSITVAEGFEMAWGPEMVGTSQTASVRIVLTDLPDDAKVVWPNEISAEIEVSQSQTVGPDVKAVKIKVSGGTLKLDPAESSENGRVAVFDYTRILTYDNDITTGNTDPDATAIEGVRSFTITPTGDTKFMGDASVDVAAMLYPMARRGTDGEKLNLASILSFEHALVDPDKDMGKDWLVVSECVTYLLYPFVTCGATPGWSTGLSVSNTTADGNVFGAFDKTDEQSGSVILYGFPRGMAAPAEGEVVEPVVSTVSANLMAGDTVTLDCGSTTMAGMEGYAIIRAGFQHARGMAFVLGNFSEGAAVDVSHGYMAEVIDDPNERTDKIEEE